MEKKSILFKTLPFFFLILLASPLYGGSGTFGFVVPDYAGIGGSFVREDIQGDINFQDTGGLNLKVGFDFFKALTLEVNFDYLPEFGGKGQVAGQLQKEKNDILNLMVVAKFPLILSHPLFKTSLIFGMGVFYAIRDFQGKVTGSGVSKEDTDTGLSLKFGGGVDIYITQNISLGAEGTFVQLFGADNKSNDKIKFFMLTLWVAYRF